jgi:hypothetical protein
MIYTVKRGDSLSRIATAHGVTLAKLLESNPDFKLHPDRISVGDRIEIPDEVAEPATESVSHVTRPTLGKLSEKYETGGRGPGIVSSGRGDAGGVSYGSYQMTSRNGGTVGLFVSQPDFPWREAFQGLEPGSDEFTRVWRTLADEHPEEFFAAQHAFIKATHYDRLVKKIRQDDGLDVTQHSHALQDVIWSTAVQHGPGTNVVRNAFNTLRDKGLFDPTSEDFDRNSIKAIYSERGRKNADGNLVYFSRNSPEIQAGVAKRFVNEEQDALRMLDA